MDNNNFEKELDNELENESTPNEEKAPEKKSSFLRAIIENLEVVVCAACAVILIFTMGFRVCAVNGTSMYPTLDHEDKLLVSNLFYTPERGDIIVFHMTGEVGEKFNEPLVKRVIATGGEWLDIDFNTWEVRVADNPQMENATIVDEPYIYLGKLPRFYGMQFPIQVPEGHLFVMGDNRYGSADSRNSMCGFVDQRRVMGKVLMRLYPFDKIEYN